MEMERRHLQSARAAIDTGNGNLSGYAAVFFRSDLPGTEFEQTIFGEKVKERIMPGAFKRAIGEGMDVRALFNHNSDHLLGRTGSKTLELREDKIGLHYSIKLPDTQLGSDVHALVKRGDLYGSSFAFVVKEEKWEDGEEFILREIHDVDLFDVGPVTYAAYEATSVSARSLPFNEAVIMFRQGKSMIVQTMLFLKEKWTVDEAKKWLKEHNYRSDKVDEGENYYRFRQRDPDEFIKDSERTIEFEGIEGVKAVVGKLKDGRSEIIVPDKPDDGILYKAENRRENFYRKTKEINENLKNIKKLCTIQEVSPME